MNTTIYKNNSKTDKQINTSISNLHTGSHITPVYLNLYDLGGCNNTFIHSIGLSFYHCAIQTHSAEYGYMGHPYKFTGLYKTSKYDSRFHLYRLRDSIEIGWTWFNEKEIDKIVNDLKPFYLGLDYHTTNKNSILFAKYFLEQLSNDSQLKHLQSTQIIQFPSYIDRARRLSKTLQFLQIFDTEKDIAEINILYFLYMKYEGNLKNIFQILKYNTIDQLKRSIKLIEQGIQEKKLPIFPLFTTFDMNTPDDYLNNSDILSNNEQLTLTDIFHQFDTITLRGRTSIDRYLNIQRAKQLNVELPQISDPTISHIHRSSQPQARSQNQDRTPVSSPSGSNISGLMIPSNASPTVAQTTPIFIDLSNKFQHLKMRKVVPIRTVHCLQETPNSDLPLTELHLRTNIDHNSFSLINNRQRKVPSSSHKRKLPRDLELTSDLYTIINQNSVHHNYTNNAIPLFTQTRQSNINIISFKKNQTNEDTDSSV